MSAAARCFRAFGALTLALSAAASHAIAPPPPPPDLFEFNTDGFTFACRRPVADGPIGQCRVSYFEGWVSLAINHDARGIGYALQRVCAEEGTIGRSFRYGRLPSGPLESTEFARDAAAIAGVPVQPECLTNMPAGDLGPTFLKRVERAVAIYLTLLRADDVG